jgi:hypothetical protein
MLKKTIIATIVILLVPMAGTTFAEEYKTISGVGKDAGDGMTVYDIQYSSVKNIVSSSVSTKDKSINFVLVGKTDTNSTLILKLPTGLISGPLIGVLEDGQIITSYVVTEKAGYTMISIPINPLTENISIIGTTVVPEFGLTGSIVLTISSIITIVIAVRFRQIYL